MFHTHFMCLAGIQSNFKCFMSFYASKHLIYIHLTIIMKVNQLENTNKTDIYYRADNYFRNTSMNHVLCHRRVLQLFFQVTTPILALTFSDWLRATALQ